MANPITPETRVHLLSVPLEYNMKNTLWFTDTNAQYDYFYSKRKKSNIDFTYQRKDKVMTVPYLVDEIYNCNYVMYQNHNFTNKWFYAFITKMEYVDEETSRLYIETDPVQTWLKDYEVKQSFVEREHTNNDTIGRNTIPENLDLGEPVINKINNLVFHSSYRPCLAVTELPADFSSTVITLNPIDRYLSYGGIFSGVAYIVGENEEGLSNIIKVYDRAGKADSIISCFMIPDNWCDNLTANDWTTCNGWGWSVKYAILKGASDGSQVSFTKPTTLDGHTPRNKKLLTYPYVYFNLDNNAGTDVTFHYEDFKISNNYAFEIDSQICPGISSKISPTNYKKQSEGGNPFLVYEYSIPLAKLPICSWNSDTYVNYMTENSVNIGLGLLAGAGILASAIATGGATAIIGASLGGSSVLSSLAELRKASLLPDQARGNTGITDVNFTLGLCNPVIYEYSLRNEYAVLIDKFFDIYGYKTNITKVPNYNHRRNYWYTKTIDCNITGDIPEEDMERIKQCYNEGITFWKNPSNMYNYDVDNSII